MQIFNALVLLAGACGVLARSPQHVGKRMDNYVDVKERFQPLEPLVKHEEKRQAVAPVHLNANTKRSYSNWQSLDSNFLTKFQLST